MKKKEKMTMKKIIKLMIMSEKFKFVIINLIKKILKIISF
jgi:hypothetical protein